MASTECPRCVVLSREVESLRTALESRDVIGQAKGLVMAATGCDPDEAFKTLVHQSQYENRKLRAIAADLVARPRTISGTLVYEPVHAHDPARRHLSNTLTASTTSQGRTATVILAGEADFASAETLTGCLDALLDTHDLVVVDLAGITFADSRFVTTIHHAAHRQPVGRLRVRNEPANVRRLKELFGFALST